VLQLYACRDRIDIQKRRKVDGAGAAGPGEKAAMLKLYNETNALETSEGEKLNTYFVDPVNRNVSAAWSHPRRDTLCATPLWLTARGLHVSAMFGPPDMQDYPDYFVIIKRPICMKQIKKKIDKDANYTLSAFKADMHLLWDNARMYNVEGSWVHNAAEDMQEHFDKAWQEEVDSRQGGGGVGGGGVASAVPGGLAGSGGAGGGDSTATGSAVNSGTSTPMYKPPDMASKGIGKIKLNMGQSKRREMVVPDEEDEQDDGEGGEGKGGQDSGGSDSEDDDDY
jgi:ATP-dependent helicase STH1/SNF2